jgi:hypothetical protein
MRAEHNPWLVVMERKANPHLTYLLFPARSLTDFLQRLCPLLNGTIKQEDAFNNAAFMNAPPGH